MRNPVRLEVTLNLVNPASTDHIVKNARRAEIDEIERAFSEDLAFLGYYALNRRNDVKGCFFLETTKQDASHVKRMAADQFYVRSVEETAFESFFKYITRGAVKPHRG